MKFNELVHTPRYLKSLNDFISFKTLKGFPCPFCRCPEPAIEKEHDGISNVLEVRILCKYCRRVENYVMVYEKDNAVSGIINYRTVLWVNDDWFLDINKGIYTITPNIKLHKSIVIDPIFIDYLDINKLILKVETLLTFS